MKIFYYLKSFNIIGVILWLLLAAMIFFLLKFVWRWLQRLFNLGGTSILSLTESDKENIAQKSSDFLSNGNFTYRSASAWLHEKMYTTSGVSWFATTDKAAVGNFMLTVKPSEYILLNNVYKLYKDEKMPFWAPIGKWDDLSEDLRDLFDASEETKYLSHLSQVLL